MSTERRPVYLVLAGGGALGAYIAGALTTVYDVLEARERSGDGRHAIRGIVGASAGGLSGAIFARVLVSGDDRALAALRRAWVDVFSIDAVMNERIAQINPLGLFYAEGIIKESRSILAHPEQPAPWKPYVGAPLHLGLATTNLHGIPYELNVARGRAYPFVSHVDRLEYTLSPDESADEIEAKWRTIGLELPATSAFPLLFPARDEVKRTLAVHYPRSKFDPDVDLSGLQFLDGGLTSAEAFVQALEMIAEAEPSPAGKPIVILVDPKVPEPSPPNQAMPFLSLLGRSLSALLSEAGDNGWIRLSKSGPVAPDEVEIWAIHPARPLAGAFAASFGSLFKTEWRAHDFAVGQRDAYEVLLEAKMVPSSLRVPERPERVGSGFACVGWWVKARVLWFLLRRTWLLLPLKVQLLAALLIAPAVLLLIVVGAGALTALFELMRRLL